MGHDPPPPQIERQPASKAGTRAIGAMDDYAVVDDTMYAASRSKMSPRKTEWRVLAADPEAGPRRPISTGPIRDCDTLEGAQTAFKIVVKKGFWRRGK